MLSYTLWLCLLPSVLSHWPYRNKISHPSEDYSPRPSAGLTPGNILITQPNEIETHRFLIEATTSGKFVNAFSIDEHQPIEVAFINGEVLILDFRKGVFKVSPTGTTALWGSANSTTLPGGSLFSMASDGKSTVYVLNLNPTSASPMDREPQVVQFDATGKKIGVAAAYPTLGRNAGAVGVDGEGSLWVAERQSLSKFSKGKLVGTYTPLLKNVSFYGGFTNHPTNKKAIIVAAEGKGETNDFVIVLDDTGSVLNHFPLQGKGPGGNPCGMATQHNGTHWHLFVESADSEDIGTQHVQVYDLKTEKYLYGFGGDECGDKPPNYCCQTFNGLGIIPKA